MEDNRCFEPGCALNVEFSCQCSSPPAYTCKVHAFSHMEVPNKDHALKSIFVESCEKTREASLFRTCDSSIEEFNNKVKEVRNFRNIIIEEDLKEKSEILESSKSLEERGFKVPCSKCESDSSAPKASVKLACQDIVSTYQPKPSLFNIVNKNNQTNLLIYNTEIESQASIILDTLTTLGYDTCITQLPNGKLFCFGNSPPSGVTLLIDENYKVEELPSGALCYWSSVIYFNNNIYCFGGCNENSLTLSSRFELDRNQWYKLTPLPKPDYQCNSILFNGSILISGYKNKNLLRYSIDSNSFSTIPYDFAEFKRKILINAERLYLIECYYGWIYESEIGSDTAWRKITNNSTINFTPDQTYCHYTQKEIYIGGLFGSRLYCFKFKLNEKRLIKLV